MWNGPPESPQNGQYRKVSEPRPIQRSLQDGSHCTAARPEHKPIRHGGTLLYEVSTKGGLSVAAGLDMLSLDEKTALVGIVDRLGEKGNGR